MTDHISFKYSVTALAILSLAACGGEGPDEKQAAAPAAGVDQETAENADGAMDADADADNVDGTITAAIGGDEGKQTWYITSTESDGFRRSQSDYSGSAGSLSFNLFGHKNPSRANSNQALTIGFSYANDQASFPTVDYMPGTSFTDTYSSGNEGGTAELTVDSLSEADGIVTLSGTFTATLTYDGEAAGRTHGDQIVIENGRFEGEVGELEF